MFRMIQRSDYINMSEKSPHYVCRALVEVMDNRKDGSGTERMEMFFKADSDVVQDAKDIMRSYLRELGYSCCGIDELEIRECVLDEEVLFLKTPAKK